MLDDFNLGADVLGTAQDARGVILAQTGDTVAAEVLSDNAEWWQHVGFSSRPARAQAGRAACQTIAISQGSNDACIASRDTRCALPAGLGFGETCIYAGGPNNAGTGQLRLSDDGSTATITASVKNGNTSGGAVIKISLKSDGVILIDSGNGHTLTINQTAIVIDAGSTNSITIDSGGIKLGSGASLAVALAPAITTWMNNMLLTLASGSNSGGPIVWGVPPPVVPDIASTKVTAL